MIDLLSFCGGWGVSPTGKSYSFRSCVRACERARRGEAKLCAGVRRGAS